MRVFIAIQLPKELRGNVQKVQEDFSKIGKLKLVEKENFHLTLKFLGEISEEEKKKVVEILIEKIKFKNFCITLKGVGVFPSKNYVRVIWVGVEEGKKEVIELQKSIDKSLYEVKFKKDEKFHPHITLARVKWIDKNKLKELLEKYKDKNFGNFTVSSIDVMKSELRARGPVYSLLKRIQL